MVDSFKGVAEALVWIESVFFRSDNEAVEEGTGREHKRWLFP